MTESSTLTVYQRLRGKLGVTDPAVCCLLLIERVEKLEALVRDMLTPQEQEAILAKSDGAGNLSLEPKKKMGRPKGSKNKE
jgi:hypothetical protein